MIGSYFDTFEIVNLLTIIVGVVANVATIHYLRKYRRSPAKKNMNFSKATTLIIGQSFFSFDLIFLLSFGNRQHVDLTAIELVIFMAVCLAGAYLLVKRMVMEIEESIRLHTGWYAALIAIATAIVLTFLAYPLESIRIDGLKLASGLIFAVVVGAVGLPRLRRSKSFSFTLMMIGIMAISAFTLQISLFSSVAPIGQPDAEFVQSGLGLTRLQCLIVMDTAMLVSLAFLLNNDPRQHWRRYAVSVGLVAVLSVIIFVSTDRAMTESSRYFELARLAEKLKSDRLELRDIALAQAAGKTDRISTHLLSSQAFTVLNSFNETVRRMDQLIASSQTSSEIKEFYFGNPSTENSVYIRQDLMSFLSAAKSKLGLVVGGGSTENITSSVLDTKLRDFSRVILDTARTNTQFQVLVQDMSLMGGMFIVAFMVSGVLIPAHTSTVRALDELEAERARVYKLAICAEHTTKGIALTNPAGQISWCNDAFTEMTGFALEAVKGLSIIRVLRHPDANMAALGQHIERLQRAQSSELEVLARRKDQSDLWLKGVVTPVEFEDGSLQFVHVYEDVTETRKIRQRLEKAKDESDRLALIARHASDGMAILDERYKLRWMNPAMEKLGGYTAEELKNQDLSRFLSGPLTNTEVYNSVIRKTLAREPASGEFLFYPKYGPPHWIEASHTPIFDQEGQFTGYIIVHRDITERKNLELQLIAHRDELAARVEERTQTIRNQSFELEKALARERELNRMQTEFVSMASHEFRTPLTIIDGTARRLEKNAAKVDPEAIREKTQNIRSAVKRMTMLVERTLDASRLSSGRIKLTPEFFNFKELIGEVIARQKEVAASHTIEVDMGDIPEEIFGDARLLDNVVTNVISNAVKYSGEERHVWVRGYEENGYAVIKVRDSGIGIPKNELSKIFQRFFRASTSTGIPGTGIGLNLVKSLVEMHYGLIEIESEEGAWTEVTVKLPLESPLQSHSDEQTEDEEAARDVA